MVLGQDADFSDERFEVRYTSELAKGIGNLTNRTLSMLTRYREGKVPNYDGFHLTELEHDLRSDAVVEEYKQAVAEFAPHLALQAIWKFAQRADKYVEETAPFRLAKDPEQAKRLDVVLGHLVESVRRVSVLIQAALPFTAIKMRAQLNLPLLPVRLEEARFGNSLRGHTIGQVLPLFPPLEEKPKA
jgi:methionyl-tRNA synthetase